MSRKGNLFIISGPSGAGKGSLVARILSALDDAWVSVSATTRAPRPGEVEGVSYFFVSKEEFERMIADKMMLEWACYNGNYYGTPLRYVQEHLEAGQQVILEIEYQGAFQVKSKMPEAHLIFVEPPSLDELRRRLIERGTENEEEIERRILTAKVELSKKKEYDITFVNDDLENTASAIVSYINGFAD
ncbi:MAG: guanylate kinase [Eggerthellaceae bacterium]|nr:guanylate kinase [Eggerthellaceae bacterium]